MRTEYNFLLLEDVESDAELVMDHVRLSGLDCHFKWVDNETDFIRELKEFKPDLILSDYSLPTYNGLSALKYVLKTSPDRPVIMVTGSINEETAVLCMKTGAVDYVLKDKMSRLGLAVLSALDNTNIKREQKAAQDEIKKLSTVVEQSPVAITMMDTNGLVEFVNPSFINLTGYSTNDIRGKSMQMLDSHDLPEGDHDKILKNAVKGNCIQHIFHNEKKDGSPYSVSAYIAPFKDSKGKIIGLIEILEDITQRIHDQKQIENDLKEKELLLQEIYHRVNNNMQIMISLLNMQIDRTDQDGEKNVLRMAQSRVGAISAIHNDIYQEKSFAAINMSNVVNHIFNILCDTLMVPLGNISLEVAVDIPEFGLDLAQPSALIINELLSNCVRHAFPDGKGEIKVSLRIDKMNNITLGVSDNGIGIPASFNPETSNTTGLSLVYMLAQGQLEGIVEFTREKGTSVVVTFEKICDKKRF